MGFTNNCLITKNTEELRNKLIKLGRIEERNNGNSYHYDCLLCYDNKFIQLDVFDPIDLIELEEDEYVNCMDKEDMFLAIASLRDDLSKNQWFVDNNNNFIYCEQMELKNVLDNNIQYENYCVYDFHKATVQELIEHFK